MQKFSYEISDDVYDLFDELCNSLGPPKYKIIEASIEVFAALPKEAQYILKGQDESDRKAILSRLRSMNLKAEKGKRA